MSGFMNTRDTIGEQATVDKLVEGSLTELKEDGVGIIGEYALYSNKTLQSVEFPKIRQIKPRAFNVCTHLNTVKLGGYGSSGEITLGEYAFEQCEDLTHLVIDRMTKATLAASNTLSRTKIAAWDGAVYVPDSMISTYKADSLWKTYFITSLDKYPLSDFDSIEDSWQTIFSNPDYASDYTIGGTKTLELTDGTKIRMELVGIDSDDKSDSSGKAKLSWISKNVYPSQHRFNAESDNSGGWAESEIRSWLISDVLPLIPETVRSHIVPVQKTYRTKAPNDETLISSDSIWVPSFREVGFTASSYVESNGVVYSDAFATNASRKKYSINIVTATWTLRSAFTTSAYRIVGGEGDSSNAHYGSNVTQSFAFGFCTD